MSHNYVIILTVNKLPLIFFLAFSLNWIWENFHSYLYLNYRGKKITQKILIRVSFIDAFFITIMAIFFIEISYFRLRMWYSLFFGLVAAALLESYALKNNRWKYNKFMPIIPIVKTSLIPTIQLGLISYLIYTISIN